MKRKRGTHRAEFKACVAAEALMGIKPIHEIAAETEIHSVQDSQWEKGLTERMTELFERKNARFPGGRGRQAAHRCSGAQARTGDHRAELAPGKVQGAGDRLMRKQLIDRDRPQLSIRRQAALVSVNRRRLDSKPRKPSQHDLALRREIDELHLEFPVFGAGRVAAMLASP